MPNKRAFLVVLDSVGIGAAPDAGEYGDEGANTLGHIAEQAGPLSLPALERMGLACIPPLIPGGLPLRGLACPAIPSASFGALMECSKGKDTTTGHWEIAGVLLTEPLALFPKGPPSFPESLTRELEARTGRRIIGNKAASGTAIIDELGEAQLRDGSWIVYTSADSVVQIAAHEQVIPLDELYRACLVARELCNPLRVGRVIARPYIGHPGAFTRTLNRRDFSLPPPEPTILDRLSGAGIPVTTVGKLDDIFCGRGITRAVHVEDSASAMASTLDLATSGEQGLVFVNLIDFDMLYGHRRDPRGYAGALADSDRFIAALTEQLTEDDLLIITADHGNDPTFAGTDHTREFVPLLSLQPGRPGRNLGIRRGFFDIAQSLATFFGISPIPRGVSFL